MKWYKKFKVGQEVRVIQKVSYWRLPEGGGSSWNPRYMDKTIGKVYKIIEIKKQTGYKLFTQIDAGDNSHVLYRFVDFWYPAESLEEINVKGKQLLFNFMNEE